MPRPPSKRSRPAPSILTAAKGAPQRSSRRQDTTSSQVLGSPPERNQLLETATQFRLTTQVPDTSRQAGDQTPISDAQEYAIESSPMGERGATGSRPPTRSRGYSSTLSVAGRKAEPGFKVPVTPAFESSILSNFRRRPRQPSILQMMQAEDGSSDFDDDDFLGGFSPEDESTPLNLSRGKSLMMQSAVASSPSQVSLPSSGGSRKRGRSSNENVNPEVLLVGIESGPVSPAPSPSHNHEEEMHASAESPRPRESLAMLTQTMASPLSSSLPPSPASAAILCSAQPLEGLRNPVAGKTERQSDNRISLPTTALQDKLLPRRRQRWRRPLHIPNVEDSNNSSDEDGSIGEQEEDEISFLPGKRTAWSQRKRPKTLRNPRDMHVTRKTTKGYEHKADSVEKHGSKQTKDTNENPQQDKDNKEFSTSSISPPPNPEAFDAESLPEDLSLNFTSDELRAQARKFAEVDNWEMEFEDLPTSQNSPG